MKGSGGGGIFRTGSRDGLSELVLLGGRFGGDGDLGLGHLCALSSSQREEQRKTAGKAALLRGGALFCLCDTDKSECCRFIPPADSLMNVN